MEYVTLGRSGLKISRLGFGGIPIQRIDAEQSKELMDAIRAAGINYIDTAMAVARYMGIPIIDAGSRSMINQEHAQYLADQIHHTELGGKQYARTIWMELKDMLPLLKAK